MKPKNFSTLTWNINSIKQRIAPLKLLLNEYKPDVVCLQEIKCETSAFPFSELQDTGYHCSVYGQKTYNGVAILSKAPMSKVICGFENGFDASNSRLIRGTTQSGITVFSVYAPNGQEIGAEKYFYKLNWYRELLSTVKSTLHHEQKVQLLGDFNVAPDDLDVHDPAKWTGEILCSDRERKAFQAVLECGFVDTFRKLNPKKTQFTWWDYRAGSFQRNAGLRIDCILSSMTLSDSLTSCETLSEFRKMEKPSDHAPVMCSLII